MKILVFGFCIYWGQLKKVSDYKSRFKNIQFDERGKSLKKK